MKRILLMVISLIMVFVVVACGVPTQETQAQEIQVQETKESPEKQNDALAEQEAEMPGGAKKVNILLMGSMNKDFSNEDDPTYALTHILITLDPENRIIKFTTFPYNLGVDVETENGVQVEQLQMLCGAYGEDETANIIAESFGISIDYWVLMNMNGVVSIVDAMQGIEIDIKELSVNEASKHVVDLLGLAWEEITQTGLQMLSGVQSAGYFVDTMNIDQNNWLYEEEIMFRNRHSNIIRGVFSAVKLAELSREEIIVIATNIKNNYATNIPQSEWQVIADTALYCLSNDPQFLHVPQIIDTANQDGNPPMVFDRESDVSAVQEFVK